MTKEEEAKIRREGFPITRDDAKTILHFIEMRDPQHLTIEPDIIVRLELLAGIHHIEETKNVQANHS